MKYGNQSLQSPAPLFHSFYTKERNDQTRVSTASAQSHRSVDIQASNSLLGTTTNQASSNTELEAPNSTMAAASGYENGRIKEPRWGEDTDYIFYADPLPKLSEVEQESNARVLTKMLRQKLIYRIKLLTGREPRLRSGGGHYLDPLKSDPTAPYFYEWRFTPEYPGFPLRPLGNWLLSQVKDCNMALENGDLYLVDVRNPGPRPPPKQKAVAAAGVPDSVSAPNGIQNRKRLVGIAENAFARYIVLQTGIKSFDNRIVLSGNGSTGLPGWRWVFPETGVLTKFPDQNNFWSWSSDEILHALHALLMKTLRLERYSAEQMQEGAAHALQQGLLTATQYQDFQSPRFEAAPANNYDQPIHIDSDESGTAEKQLVAELNAVANPNPNLPPIDHVSPVLPVPSIVHHLDDLVAQFAARSQQWKDEWSELQESKKTIQTLRATTSQQASRIGTLEKALHEIEQLGSAYNGASNAAKNLHPAVNLQDAMLGVEAPYNSEIAELKEQNEELQDIIKNQEQDVQNAVYLQERNQVLEQQLAEKTAEAASAYEALAALAGASSSKSGGSSAYGQTHTQQHYPAPPAPESESPQPPEWMASYKVKCDRCRQRKQVCLNPGGPCDRCQKAGSKCTFTLQRYHSAGEVPDAVATARQATDAASQFLQNRPESSSPYFDAPQDQYRQQKQAPKGLYSPQPPLQSPYASGSGMSSSISQVNGSMKRVADIMLASASKRPATGNAYTSPYPAN
ncbi:hypothetical protein DL98DRAFT_516284 [Cadophora sp. DSE1049]|nr:hypothetical protein DL98DRAFT_516284 [Cadophora sp. DSE1049]